MVDLFLKQQQNQSKKPIKMITMNKLKVKIKKTHPDAVIPQYAKNGDAGMDLTATSLTFDTDGNAVYGTGLSFEIPKGFVGLLFPRSSNAKNMLLLSNAVGVIDSNYRGEVMLKFKSCISYIGGFKHWWCRHIFRDYRPKENLRIINEFMIGKRYDIGDRIGQLIIMPYPEIEFEEVDTLSETERGENGFGSTGK